MVGAYWAGLRRRGAAFSPGAGSSARAGRRRRGADPAATSRALPGHPCSPAAQPTCCDNWSSSAFVVPLASARGSAEEGPRRSAPTHRFALLALGAAWRERTCSCSTPYHRESSWCRRLRVSAPPGPPAPVRDTAPRSSERTGTRSTGLGSKGQEFLRMCRSKQSTNESTFDFINVFVFLNLGPSGWNVNKYENYIK